MCQDSECLKNWILDLIDANPKLTGGQVRNYALRIMEAEARDDLVQMNRILQEAVYGRAAGENAA